MLAIPEREVKICKATGNRVVMEHVGHGSGIVNGHSGWLCLHNIEVEGKTDEEADEDAVKQFLLDQENR